MKNVALLLMTLVCIVQLAGCQGRENTPATGAPAAGKSAKVVVAVDEAKGKASLLAFLKGLQNGDKKAVYAASNLTLEMVEESRKKIINQPVTPLNREQIDENQSILSMSGSIDLYLKKMKPLLPKSATFEVVKTGQWTSKAPNVLIHDVKITYANKKRLFLTKTAGRIKEFILRFQQVQYSSNGQLIQEFLIENTDFENMMDKKYDVKAYF